MYYDVQKSVLHVHITPIDLSITYNQPRVTSGYERFAWVFGTFEKITLSFAIAVNMLFWFCPGMGHFAHFYQILYFSSPTIFSHTLSRYKTKLS